jgi:hypothetical protein
MKLTSDRPFSDPDKAARKLVEIANAVEAVQASDNSSIRCYGISGPLTSLRPVAPC